MDLLLASIGQDVAEPLRIEFCETCSRAKFFFLAPWTPVGRPVVWMRREAKRCARFRHGVPEQWWFQPLACYPFRTDEQPCHRSGTSWIFIFLSFLGALVRPCFVDVCWHVLMSDASRIQLVVLVEICWAFCLAIVLCCQARFVYCELQQVQGITSDSRTFILWQYTWFWWEIKCDSMIKFWFGRRGSGNSVKWVWYECETTWNNHTGTWNEREITANQRERPKGCVTTNIVFFLVGAFSCAVVLLGLCCQARVVYFKIQ